MIVRRSPSSSVPLVFASFAWYRLGESQPLILPPHSSSGEQSQANPKQAGRQLERVVQIEEGHRCSTCRRGALQLTRFDVNAEMLLPAVLARMKQRHFFSAEFIEGNEPIALAQIASAASKTQVHLVFDAAAGSGQNVLHLEREIENRFGRMAIFAAMASASSYERIVRIHDGS